MIVVYCQHRDALTSAERQMVAGMRDLPGVLLVNALVTTGRRRVPASTTAAGRKPASTPCSLSVCRSVCAALRA